jgi:hypothetical protein
MVPFEIDDVHMDDNALDVMVTMVDVQSMVDVVEDASSFVDLDT